MTVLVTGADGQLAYAVRARLRSEHHVVALTRSELDLTCFSDVQECVREIHPTAIVNGAAYNDVDSAEDDPVTAMRVNAFGVRALARAASTVGATLVHFSTDFVFDGRSKEPYREDAPPNPQSVYATSKLLGEWFAGETAHYVLRVESLFGGGAQAHGGRTRGGSLDRIAEAMLDGHEVRAFIDRTVSPSYVDDVADATAALLLSSPPQGLYHCVASGMATWMEVVLELARCLNCDARVIPVKLGDLKLKACRPLFCALSNSKLASVGIPMPTWQDAVARYASRRFEMT